MNRMLKQFVVALLVFPSAISFADDKEEKKKPEVPQGYENAKKADARVGVPPLRIQVKAVVDLVEMIDDFPAAAADVNVQVLEKQFLPRFKPLVTAEFAFVNRICHLNNTQRKQLIVGTDIVLKAAVRKYATVQNEMQRGRWRFANGRQPSSLDPSKLVAQGMAHLVERSLNPEQIEIYQQEISQREDYHKQVAVKGLVAMLDEELILNADQREKLVKTLSENWQEAWVQSLQLLINDNQFLPNIPSQHLAPILSKTQMKVWRGVQKNNQVFWGGFGPGVIMANEVLFEIEVVFEEEAAVDFIKLKLLDDDVQTEPN